MKNAKLVLGCFLFLFCQFICSASANEEQIGPFQEPRTEMLEGESFRDLNQYWHSSAVSGPDKLVYLASSRASSLETGRNYDFLFTLSGVRCLEVNISIHSFGERTYATLNHQFGKIVFNDNTQLNFTYSTNPDTGAYDAIFFEQIDVNKLIKMMKKAQFMQILLPAIGKRIFYDLRGFTASFNRASQMCLSVSPR